MELPVQQNADERIDAVFQDSPQLQIISKQLYEQADPWIGSNTWALSNNAG